MYKREAIENPFKIEHSTGRYKIIKEHFHDSLVLGYLKKKSLTV
jgi:hypothetical protein